MSLPGIIHKIGVLNGPVGPKHRRLARTHHWLGRFRVPHHPHLIEPGVRIPLRIEPLRISLLLSLFEFGLGRLK